MLSFRSIFILSLLCFTPVGAALAQDSVKPAAEPVVGTEPAQSPVNTSKDAVSAVGKDESVATYERKSITYLTMLRDVSTDSDAYRIIERAVRANVELPRFDYNDVSRFEELGPAEAAKLVKEYLDKVKLERAREGAEFDVRFKDFTITGEDLRRISRSAYLYQPRVRNFSAQRQRYVIYRNGVPIVIQQWVANVSVGVTFYSVDFEAGKANELASIRSSGSGSVEIRGYQSSDSARLAAISEAANSAGFKLSKEVRKIDAFNLLTPIRATGLNSVNFELTKKEGLQLDHGFYVYDYIEGGGRERVGYVRVTKVGDGETVKDSVAQNITVSNGLRFEEGQLLQEHPQLGIKIVPEAGFQRFSLNVDDDLGLAKASTGFKLHFEVAYDIAEKFGIPEVYGTLGGHFMGSSFSEIGLEAGLDKRFYLRRLVLTPGVRVGVMRDYWSFDSGAEYFQDNLDDPSEVQNLEGHSIGVAPRFGLELFLTPELSLAARVGYRLYTPQTTLTNPDSDNQYTIPGFRYNPSGLEVVGGITYSF